MSRKLSLKLLQIIIFTIFVVNNSFAQGISLIRDSETEDLLKYITLPLANAANLEEKNLKIYIINDPAINAFVMSGQNIFVNTGLITKYQDPNILSGVIAHEIGHIAAGHLARNQEAMGDIGKMTVLTYLVGIAAIIGAGGSGGDAPYAVLATGTHVAQRLAVKHSRTQEEAADKLALEYLQKTKQSPAGLIKLLSHFNQEETQYRDLINQYAITHPISKKRVDYIKSNLNNFSYKDADPKTIAKMKFVVAKLQAFLQDGNQTLKYFNSNSSFDRYARSIAYFKKSELANSLKELNILIKEQPENGYFHELKGQILFENGLTQEAIKSYHKAIKFLPNSELAKISISSAILTLKNNDKDLVNFAIKNLNEAKLIETENLQIFQELAKAFEENNEMGKSYLALAELNLLKKDYKKTKEYADLSLEKFKNTDKSDLIKAKDILEIIKDEIEEDDEDKKIK